MYTGWLRGNNAQLKRDKFPLVCKFIDFCHEFNSLIFVMNFIVLKTTSHFIN